MRTFLGILLCLALATALHPPIAIGAEKTPMARIRLLGAAIPVERASRQVALRPGDRAIYHQDLTYHDNTKVKPGEPMNKAWDLQNGAHAWKGWYLVRRGPRKGPGLIESAERYRIPDVPANSRFRLEIDAKAPKELGVTVAEFEYRNEQNKPPFSGGLPLTIKIVVAQ